MRSVKARRGQWKFRRALIKRYGSACLVTGSQTMDLLEAAHIVPYRGEEYNDPSNGLLLRADIHTLFDLNLLRIEPKTCRIALDSKVRDEEYRRFHGRYLKLERARPSDLCLSIRWVGEPP